jgi:CMP-N,N'-diacetyllegionaminic acid synthase
LTVYPASDEIIGLIPARGGSKGVPHKNIVPLLGEPLLRFVVEAGRAARGLGRIFCSTDDAAIATVAAALGVIVAERPAELAGDDSPVLAAIVHFLEELGARERRVPATVVLLQPTSPFLLPEHIEACLDGLKLHPTAQSAQTVTSVPHNMHAFNQREFDGPFVRFRFEEERNRAYNRQRKPVLYGFGNLYVTRSDALLRGEQVYAKPSFAVEIPLEYALELDSPEDFAAAERAYRSRPIAFIKSWIGEAGPVHAMREKNAKETLS